jgi:glycerol-3-phosphate dehydrogenase (NAD(P)+)
MYITVIGGGSWATALCRILTENPENRIRWYMRNHSQIETFNKTGRNTEYLTDIQLDTNRVLAVNTLDSTGTDALLYCIPAAHSRDIIRTIKRPANQPFISAAKGLIPDLGISVTEFVTEIYNTKPDDLYMIAGPCHSEEVAQRKQSYLTLCGSDTAFRQQMCAALTSPYTACRGLDDLKGAEMASVLKNIYAMTCGIALGLGFGDNFLSVLVSNALREMEIILSRVNKYPSRNVLHSAFAGDLLVTCYSAHSRNRRFGEYIGSGLDVKSAKLEMKMVAEGYTAVGEVVRRWSQETWDLELIRTAYRIVREGGDAREEFEWVRQNLM